MSDRKYGHRGYQEDAGERPARQAPAPRQPTEGPRGRGLGAPTRQAFRCAVCGAEQPSVAVGPDSCCPACGKDLRTCTHCVYFDTASRFECRKPITAAIRGKAKRNECEHFEPRVTQELGSDKAVPSDVRAAFDALFKL